MRDPNDELSLRQATADYPVSRDTLLRRIRRGALPHRRFLNRILVRRGDLEAVLFGRGRKPAATR